MGGTRSSIPSFILSFLLCHYFQTSFRYIYTHIYASLPFHTSFAQSAHHNSGNMSLFGGILNVITAALNWLFGVVQALNQSKTNGSVTYVIVLEHL